MDEKQQALYDELAAVVDIPVGENPLQNTKQAIVMAERHKILWRWAKDGPYYEFRWTPAHPPIKIPESQANVYLVKRIIQELTPDKTPEDSKSALEYDITPKAKELLLKAGLTEEQIATVPGTGAEGKIIVRDVDKFLQDV